VSSCSDGTPVDELVAVTGWPVASVLAGLTLLERRGLAGRRPWSIRPAGTLAGMDPAIARQRPATAPKRSPVRTRRDRTPWHVTTRRDRLAVCPDDRDRCYPSARSFAPGTSPRPRPRWVPRPRAGVSIASGRHCAAGLSPSPVRPASAQSRDARPLARVSLALGLSFRPRSRGPGCRSAGDSRRDPPQSDRPAEPGRRSPRRSRPIAT
jgi:hypothetical protein